MYTQVICKIEAYTITDHDTYESWLLSAVEFCNGTFAIIKGNETRLYKTRRRFVQAWHDMMVTINVLGWTKQPIESTI